MIFFSLSSFCLKAISKEFVNTVCASMGGRKQNPLQKHHCCGRTALAARAPLALRLAGSAAGLDGGRADAAPLPDSAVPKTKPMKNGFFSPGEWSSGHPLCCGAKDRSSMRSRGSPGPCPPPNGKLLALHSVLSACYGLRNPQQSKVV